MVEPSLRVEHREELLWLLGQACELEHGLMCEYLFAQFSLKRSGEMRTAAEPAMGAWLESGARRPRGGRWSPTYDRAAAVASTA
jgi:hypothetical protein